MIRLYNIEGEYLVTKGVIKSINRAGNRCQVRIPLFESAASSAVVEAEALVNIMPGFYQNLFVDDVVFVAFEENAIEKPIIIGKLFRNKDIEGNTKGGMGILDTLKVRTAATIPPTTLYEYTKDKRPEYKDLETPKKTADYIKWLEKLTKNFIKQLTNAFVCFKSWTQWQLRPENVEIDDGDLDDEPTYTITYGDSKESYQEENKKCKICDKNCVYRDNNNTRTYSMPDTSKEYPKL